MPLEHHLYFVRFENHRGRLDPVGEENGGRHDPDRLCPRCVCPRWPSTLYGKSASKVRPMAHPNK